MSGYIESASFGVVRGGAVKIHQFALIFFRCSVRSDTLRSLDLLHLDAPALVNDLYLSEKNLS